MQFADVRLGFISDRWAFVDGGIWVDPGVGRVLEILTDSCRRLTFAMASAPYQPPWLDMRLNLSDEHLLRLPSMPSVARAFHKAWSCRRVIREVERRSDVVIVQLPFAAPLALLSAKRPRVYHLCGDIYEAARNSNACRGYRRVPAVMVGSAIDRIQRRLVHARNARVVSNGSQLWELYDRPAGRAVVSSTILDREIMSVRRTRPADAPFRVLFVGILGPRKGVDTLIDAFEQVIEQLPDAELVIAGPRDVVDHGLSEFLERRLAELKTKSKVQRLGHLNYGPELFQQFADADVLAVPSRSEGTPRVLVEARAFGCPVIGTRVGGIPTSISDGVDGLLIPSDDPGALRDAIMRLARDRQLRAQLVAGGIRRARASTVEAFVRAMSEEIEQLVPGAATN